jgi:hypothetical protein
MSTDQPAQPAQPAPASFVPPHHGLLLPSLAALVAALVGGIAWALVVEVTEYEIGFAAVGIGLLAGFAAALAMRGPAGELLPFVVAALAAVGVLFGKLLSLYFLARAVAASFDVAEGPLSLTVHNLDLPGFWSLFDVLWLFLAMMAAFRFTSSRIGEQRMTPAM